MDEFIKSAALNVYSLIFDAQPCKKVPTISIVILNFNGRGFLQQFLPFVTASLCPGAEVIVADNASTDDSLVFLKEHYPGLRTIVLDRNYGFAGGYNQALSQVQSEYYVLLNSDVEVAPGWVEPCVNLMEADLTIGACQPKIRMYADRGSFEYAGAAGWLAGLAGISFRTGSGIRCMRAGYWPVRQTGADLLGQWCRALYQVPALA